ncbi:MAG TPA: L-ribulose-5-phosphate 4-epimerase AraD [Terriglobales bacterium]
MLLKDLRHEVLRANLELQSKGLVLYTFGNASGISRREGLVVIKPSGVPYEELTAETLAVTDLEGKVVEGDLRPSSDLATHLVLYKQFATIGGIAHTHSEYATAWAQARQPIPCFGTTHADYFHGAVPVTNASSDGEIDSDYEQKTGEVIARVFDAIDYAAVAGVLVASHGPFTWGKDALKAAETAVILEMLARTAYLTIGIDRDAGAISQALQDKHYLRKHGTKAYYGQVRNQE